MQPGAIDMDTVKIDGSGCRAEFVRFLGVGVHRVDMTEAIATIERFIASRTPHQVITADASAVVMAQTDPALRELLNTADLVTPDSAGILWAARKFGAQLQDRVSGVDIAQRICELSAAKGYRLFFFGAAPGVAEKAADEMRTRFPGIQIVGTRNGFFTSADEAEIIREIRAANPDVLLVALGIPKQEFWIVRNKEAVSAPVSMGVGGTFDVFAGIVRRAPEWMQRLNLEWLWRLAQNPRKIGKVMLLPRFAMLVWRSRKPPI